MRQAQVTRGVIGNGGFGIAIEVGQVGAQVKPGIGVLRIGFSFGAGDIQGVAAVVVDIPVWAQDIFYSVGLFRPVNYYKDPVERLPQLICLGIRNNLVRAAKAVLADESLAGIVVACD